MCFHDDSESLTAEDALKTFPEAFFSCMMEIIKELSMKQNTRHQQDKKH